MQKKILFEMWKETAITSTDIKRAKLQQVFPNVNINDLHREIVNYQVKKYGASLNDYRDIEDYQKVVFKANDRRRKRLGK